LACPGLLSGSGQVSLVQTISLKAQIMNRLGRILERIANGLSIVTGGIAAFALLASAIIITEGVIVRKILGASTIWQIEASVYLLMYACFVGAAYAQMHEHHLNVDLIIIHLSPRSREITLIVVSILSCIICAVIAWYGWPMWWEAFVRGDRSASLWGPPLAVPYFFIPFGMSLLFFQYIVYIANKIKILSHNSFEETYIPSELKGVESHREKKE
jgi:TRAP-type C4-dicarboxylate transport system permease small subunit